MIQVDLSSISCVKIQGKTIGRLVMSAYACDHDKTGILMLAMLAMLAMITNGKLIFGILIVHVQSVSRSSIYYSCQWLAFILIPPVI